MLGSSGFFAGSGRRGVRMGEVEGIVNLGSGQFALLVPLPKKIIVNSRVVKKLTVVFN